MGFQGWENLALNGSKRGRLEYTASCWEATMEIPGKTLLSSIVASRFRVLFMVFALLTAVPALRSQTAKVLSHTVSSANPPDTVHLAKAAANFTSTSYPSYFLGTSSNGYVYDTQTGQNCSVQVPGSYYERSR